MPAFDSEKPGFRMRLTARWKAEGRLAEIDSFRRELAKACVAKGMMRKFANEEGWRQAIEKFPPLPEEEFKAIQSERARAVKQGTDPDTGEARGGRDKITGLDRIPVEWGELPANASFRAELQWVNANRLAMLTELASGTTRVQLSKAKEPAPSRSALGWLETAITNRAKFMDLLAKSSGAGGEDDSDDVRRERTAISEIESILKQMGAGDLVGLMRRLVALCEGTADGTVLSEAKAFLEQQ